jgi:hypothetical protein
MIPAKSRERKCSTCRHYQPSPLWRKGWCRNPLLYDRNTNHLVEADSLACNRTFIDYWEPREGDAPAAGPQPRTQKPRIAASIPVETIDAKGKRNVSTGTTPAAGMAAVAPKPGQKQTGRERPPLSLVTSDYAEAGAPISEEPSKVTVQIEQIDATAGTGQMSARQRIAQARALGRPKVLSMFGVWLWPALAVAGVLILLVGSALLFGKQAPTQRPNVTGQATMGVPEPTPTGVGDPTPTANIPPTAVAPSAPPDQIAVGGWAQVANTRTGLRVRSEPSSGGRRLTVVPDGTKLRVVGGPVQANGYTWWQVEGFDQRNPSARGWCAGEFLVPTTAP